MEKQISAVEWLLERVDVLWNPDREKLIEQAKQMEKEQREKEFIEGYKKRAELSCLIFDEASELFAKELFNKTFKSE